MSHIVCIPADSQVPPYQPGSQLPPYQQLMSHSRAMTFDHCSAVYIPQVVSAICQIRHDL